MQEQQTWHRVHSCPISATSQKLLSNKYQFEQQLRNTGINCVRTIDLITQGNAFPETKVFQSQSRFIKPNSANAMRGCMLLEYDTESNSYALVGRGMDSKAICENSRAGIIQQLEHLLTHDSVLMQEVLSNSVAMSEFCGSEKLLTLRIISCRVNQLVELYYAELEVESDKPNCWCIYALDIDTGVILNLPVQAENCLNLAKTNQLHSVPQWIEIQNQVRDAHLLFPDLNTIGWDLCVIKSGACIIEGNSGWGLIAPQIVGELPLLESKLYKAYTSFRHCPSYD
jgi:hypothetical protein